MDGKETQPRESDKEIERKGEEAREKIEDVPPPGTDPLHEGP